jgi:glycosyltransferase involved in cell wall biosynthesis
MEDSTNPTAAPARVFVIVAARDEADRIAATLGALARTFPSAPLWVADDGSRDATAAIAEAAGARVVRGTHPIGKGGAVTLAARAALRDLAGERPDRGAEAPREPAGERPDRGGAGTPLPVEADRLEGGEPVAVLCDGDLGDSAARLGGLVEAVRQCDADLAVAVFARRVGGGVGLAVGFARWAIRRRCGLELSAPISGQRALRASLLSEVLPFAHGFGMEVGMTIDATRAGARVGEVDLDLSHRATGRTLGGFAHRGRQLVDFVRAYLARR